MGNETIQTFSQASGRDKRDYNRSRGKSIDPIYLIMKNPLFASRVNLLICQAREKWIELERDKMRLNPFYRPAPCPVSRDSLTWISAYLKFYFLETENGNAHASRDGSIVEPDGFDDLLRVFKILLARPNG